jgi:hypothetical protein
MMIPAMAVPAFAAPGLTMTLVDPLTNSITTPDSGYNISGSRVLVTATGVGTDVTVTGWTILPVATAPGAGDAIFVTPPGTATSAMVQGTWGDYEIEATLSTGAILSIEKKFGQIDHTTLTNTTAFSPVTWVEATKSWTGNATITDNVTGAFYEKDAVNPPNPSHILFHALQGTILNWYLVPGNVAVPMGANEANILMPMMLALTVPGPTHVDFTNHLHTMQTVTDANGNSSVGLITTGEESVQVVVIPQYPFGSVNIDVTPEVTSYDFFTTEMDVVPQVRWAGEKIVLEKNFGSTISA